MPIEKEDVLEVLRDPILHKIRFSMGEVKINSDEYDKVADYIESGGVSVEPGDGKVSLYYPQTDTLHTRAGELRGNLDARTNVLHECTHIAADINEYSITRMRDEAAAYLAQFTYLMLLAPDTPKPPLGVPLNNMMRLGMQFVEDYKLGDPGVLNQSIRPDDIQSMENAVHHIPQYADIPLDERLIANGIKMTDDQWAVLMGRFASRLGDKLMADDVKEMLTTRVQYSAHENWVTSDNELITLLDSYRLGADPQKKTARQKLLHIFLTVTQASASQLLRRFSAPRKGDLVSDRFNHAFTPAIKTDMLSALQLSR